MTKAKEETTVEKTPVVAPETTEETKVVTLEDLTVPKAGDTEEQLRLKSVMVAYFKQNPERITWHEANVHLLDVINKAK